MRNKPYDLTYMLRQIGDQDLVEEIVSRYIVHVQEQLDTLKNLKPYAENLPEIHRIAHSIKGGARNIGAARMEKTAMSLEKRAKANKAHTCGGEIKKLIQAFHSLQESITLKVPGDGNDQKGFICGR